MDSSVDTDTAHRIFIDRLSHAMDGMRAASIALKDALVPFEGWHELPFTQEMELRHYAQVLNDTGYHLEQLMDRIKA